MAKVFVFCIGGTGLRVMRSITMLAASGADTHGYTIVPIFVDPHIDLEERSNVDNLVNDYISICADINKNNGAQLDPPKEGFFSAQFERTGELSETQNSTSKGMSERGTFGSYIEVNKLATTDINNFLVQTLFSEKNLSSKLEVGFKGNPNMGTVVLNEMVEGASWYDTFVNKFQKDDRVFIISSIFGGTGAAGYPLIEKLIREDKSNSNLGDKAFMGAVTVLPYYSLGNPATTGSDIDSASFYTKAKSALNYYEDKISSDYLYYAGEKVLRANYANNEDVQADKAHFVELTAATALFDFLSRSKKPGSKQALTRAIYNDQSSLDYNSLGKGWHRVVKNITDMLILCKLVKILPNETQFPLKKTRGLDNDFYKDKEWRALENFCKLFGEWYNELATNDRAFAPVKPDALIPGRPMSDIVPGCTLAAKDESYYLLGIIRESNHCKDKSHDNKFRFLLDFAYKAIDHYTNNKIAGDE